MLQEGLEQDHPRPPILPSSALPTDLLQPRLVVFGADILVKCCHVSLRRGLGSCLQRFFSGGLSMIGELLLSVILLLLVFKISIVVCIDHLLPAVG